MSPTLRGFLLSLAASALLSASLTAQSFAPLGATWTNISLAPRGYGYAIAYRTTAVRDTVVDGRPARRLVHEVIEEDGSLTYWGEELIASSGDSVLVYFRDSFRLVYDFSARAGDTIRVIDEPFPGFFTDSTATSIRYEDFAYRIDSVGTRVVEGDSLRLQYVSYLRDPAWHFGQWGFQDVLDLVTPLPGQLLEGLGHLGRHTLLGTSADISYLIDLEPDRLSCYQDTVRDYRFRGVDCPTYIANRIISSTRDLPTYVGSVYPNPVTTTLRIDYGSFAARHIDVLTVFGQPVLRNLPATSTLELATLPAGPYLLRLTDGSGQQTYARIVKQ